MSSIQSIETPQDYVNYTFNLSARGVTEVTSELAGMSSTVSNLVGLMAFKTSEYLSNTEALLVSFGYAAAATFSTATQQAIRFEQALANVKAIGGETINEVAIGQAAMQFSNRLGMNVDSMTEGLEALSRAGLTATDVMSGVLEEGVKLSKLEGMDLEDSINNLISTTNLLAEGGYDVNSQEYAEAVKAMNQHIVSTSESAPINAQNIIQTLQHVGGYASANKIDQDDLFAVIAQLGSKGTKGEMAGTALRAFIAAGQKDQAQRALQRIGLDVSDLWDSSGDAMLPISEMKRVLDEALETRGYSQQEKLEFYADFAGYKQANQIMKINTDEVQQYKESIAQAWDLGTKLDEILGTVNSNLQIIHQTAKNFLTKVGQTALPILNAILQPIKWTVQLIDALPFSENIVGIGLTFLALKGLFIGINRVVPAIASLYTSFSRQERHAKNIQGHFKNLIRDAKEFKETIEHIKDPVWLANKRMENDKRGMGAVEYGKAVAYSMYGAIGGQEITGKNFNDLSKYEQSTFVELVSSLGQDSEIYQQIVNDIDTRNAQLRDAIINLQTPSDEKITLNIPGESGKKSNLENNNDINNTRGAAKETSDSIKQGNQVAEEQKKVLKDTYSAIQGLKQYILANTEKGTNQYDIGRGIMSIARPFSEVLADAFFRRMNLKEFKTQAGTIKFDKDIGTQATIELNKIFDSVRKQASDLPDISFYYDNDAKKMKDKVQSLTKDIQDVAEIFSNTNINNMHWYQGRRALKTFDVKAIGNIGIEYSEMMNEAYIREVLKRTDFDKNSSFIKKIYDEQIDLLAESLDVDVSHIYDKAKKLEKIHDKFQSKDNKKTIDDVVASSTQWYHTSLDKRIDPSKSASKWLSNDSAKYIMDTLKINYDNSNEDMRGQFLDNIKGSDLETKWVAQQLVFALQKSQASGVYSGAETYELESMVTHLEALNQSINRLNNHQDKIFYSLATENGKFREWSPEFKPQSNEIFEGRLSSPDVNNKENLIYSFLRSVPIVLDNALPTPGLEDGESVFLNHGWEMVSAQGDMMQFFEHSFTSYLHEMTHLLLQHSERNDYYNRMGVHHPYEITDMPNNPVEEAEVNSVLLSVLKYLGIDSQKRNLTTLKDHWTNEADKLGVSNEINQDMIYNTAEAIKRNITPIFMRFLAVITDNHDPAFGPLYYAHNTGPISKNLYERGAKQLIDNNNMTSSLKNIFLSEDPKQLELNQRKEELDALEIKYSELDEVSAAENWTEERYKSESAFLSKSINELQEEIKKLEKEVNGPKPTMDARPEATKQAIEKEKLKKASSGINLPKDNIYTSIKTKTDKEQSFNNILTLLNAISKYTYNIMYSVIGASKMTGKAKQRLPELVTLPEFDNAPKRNLYGELIEETIPINKELVEERKKFLQDNHKKQKEIFRQQESNIIQPQDIPSSNTTNIRKLLYPSFYEQEEQHKKEREKIDKKLSDFTSNKNSKYVRSGTTEDGRPIFKLRKSLQREDEIKYNKHWSSKKIKEQNELLRQDALNLGLIQPEAKTAKRPLSVYKDVGWEALQVEKSYMTDWRTNFFSEMKEYQDAKSSISPLFDETYMNQMVINELHKEKQQPKSKEKSLHEKFRDAVDSMNDTNPILDAYRDVAKNIKEVSEDILKIYQWLDDGLESVISEIIPTMRSLEEFSSPYISEPFEIEEGDAQRYTRAYKKHINKQLLSSLTEEDGFTKAPGLMLFGKSHHLNTNFNATKISQELLSKVNENIKLTQKEVEHAIALGYGNIITKDALHKVKEGWVLSTIELEAIKEIGYTEIIKLNEANEKLLEAHKKEVNQQSDLYTIGQQQIDAANANIKRFNKEKIQATLDEFDRRTKWAVDRANEIFENNFKVGLTGTKRLSPGRSINNENIELPDTINQFVNRDFLLNAFKNGTPLSINKINKTADSIITRLKQGILQEQDIEKAKSIGLMDESGEFYAKQLRILQKNIKVQEALKRKEEKTLALNAERAQTQKRLEEKYSQQEEPEETMAQSFRRRKAQQRKEATKKRINDLEEQYDSESEGRREEYKRNVGLSITEKSITNQKLLGQQFINALNLISKNNKKGYELLEQVPFEDVGGGQMGFQNADADLAIDSESRQRALDIIATMQQQQKELPPILRKFVDISSHYQDIDISKNLLADITSAIKDGFREANSQMGDFLRTQAAQTEQEEREKLGTVQIGAEDYEPVSTFDDNVTRIDNNTFGKVTNDENAWKMRTDQETKEQQVVKEISTQQSLGNPQTGYEDYVPEDEGDYSQFNPVIWKNPKTGESVVFEAETDIDKTMEHDFDDELYRDYWIELKKQEAELQEERIRQQQKVVEVMNKIVNHETAKRIELEQQAELAELEQARLEAETQQVIDTSSKKGRADFVSQQFAEQEREKNEKLKSMQEDLLNINTDDYNNIKTIQEKRKEERDAFWKDIEHEEYMASEMFKDEISGLIETNKHKLGLTTPKEKDREEERKKLTNQAKIDARYGKFDHISGVSVGTYENEVDESIKEEALKKYGHLYGGTYGVNADYEGLSFLEKEKMKLDHKYGKEYIGGSGEDDIPIKRKQSWGERIARWSLGARAKINELPEKIPDKSEEAAVLRERLSGTGEKLQKIIGPMEGFNAGLERAAEIFPPLSGVAWGFNTALEFMYGIQSALEFVQLLLNSEKFVEFLVDTGLISAETAVNIAKAAETGTTYALTGAILGLEAIMTGPLLIAIAAIVAIIAVVYILEQNHANALKDSQKALEESNKSMKTALVNYKSMRNARMSETNATRQHMAALKESIALKKLEAERSKRLSQINKKAALEHDPIWGETNSLRTGVQTGNGLGGWLGFLSPIAKFTAGEYQPIADKHSENIRQTTQIVDLAQQNNPLKNLLDGYDNQYQNKVNTYYETHSRQFAQMEEFAPQLEDLYGIETQLQKTYGVEGARNSDEFLRAIQDVANETGLDGDTIGQYLDFMQAEVNTEFARSNAQAGFGEIIAQTQEKVNNILYPNEDYMGDLSDEQYNMVMAAVEDEARKAKEEMFWNGVMEYMSAITMILSNPLSIGSGELTRHIEAGNTWLGDIHNIDENKERIAKESLNVAEANLRKDYGTKSYSYYGDTPFGGAVQAAGAIGLSVPSGGGGTGSSSGSSGAISAQNPSQTTTQTTQNARKALDDAKKQLRHDYSKPTNNQQSDNTPIGVSDIMYGIVDKALDFAKHYDPIAGAVNALFGNDSDKPSTNEQVDMNKYEIHINTININTEDDPEKIKTAFMNLMIEMSEQITPRQVSRTIGQVGNANDNISEGVDQQNNNTNNNNPNPT